MCGEFGEVTVIIGLVMNCLAFVSPLCAFRDTSTYTCTMFKIYFQTGKTAQHYIGCHFVHSGCAVSEKRQPLLCTTVCNLPNDLQRRASAGPQQLSWKPRCTSTTLELVKRRHLAQLGRGLYPLYKI